MCIYDVASGKVLKLDKKYGRTLDSVSVRDGELFVHKNCPLNFQICSNNIFSDNNSANH